MSGGSDAIDSTQFAPSALPRGNSACRSSSRQTCMLVGATRYLTDCHLRQRPKPKSLDPVVVVSSSLEKRRNETDTGEPPWMACELVKFFLATARAEAPTRARGLMTACAKP